MHFFKTLLLLSFALTAASAAPQPWRPAPEIHFEPNVGQAPAAVRYLARSARSTLALTPGGATLQLRKAQTVDTLTLELLGARRNGQALAGEAPLPGISNYLQGNNRQQWRTGVAHYARVRYRDVYPGIDLVFYGNAAGELEYDLVVKPGARPEAIQLRFAGHRHQSISAEGDLVFALPGGEVRQKRPHVFQESAGGRQEIASSYVVRANGTVGLRLGEWDRDRDLVVDPVISYATYWGGASDEFAPELAVDPAGNVYLFGDTNSTVFTTTAGAFKTTRPGGPYDNYVTKFGPDGKVIWSTFLGGAGDETASGIAVDATGATYLTGLTSSSDFPVTTGSQQSNKGIGGANNEDGFVTKLNAAGSALVYSTFLGGNGDDSPTDIAISSSGEALVCGMTLSTNFPTTAGALKTRDDALLTEGFASRYDASGRFAYSTYIGGNLAELVSACTLDQSGNAYLTGGSFSEDFVRTPGAFQVARQGISDNFVMKLNAQGSTVLYNTLLGGGLGVDTALDIAVDVSGNVYLTGVAESSDFPLSSNPYQRTKQGTSDAFITKLNPTGTALVYSTFFGGAGTERGESIAVDAQGNIYALITTGSPGLTPAQPFQSQLAGGSDLFILRLSPDGLIAQHASYLGGSANDGGRSLVIDNRERAYVSASTLSTNMPGTTGGAQSAVGGARDAFWARLDFGAPAVTLSVSPSALTATGAVGSNTITRQQLSLVAPAGQRPDWNVETTTANGTQWIEVTPLSGSGSSTLDVSFRPGLLAAGTYTGTVTVVNRSANTRTPVPVTMTLTAAPTNPGGVLTSAGILSAASFQGGGVSPGLIVTIFGQRIGPDTLVSASVGSDLKFPTQVAETRVLFDGVPAPLIYVSATQVSAIVPYAVATRSTSDVVIEYRGNRSNAASVPVVAAKPGLFTANASGSGPGAIQNQDFSVNTPSNPAARGSIVVLYATGEGATDPAGVDGQVAATVFPKPRQSVAVRIGGVMAEVLYAGAAPSLVAGVLQVNVKVPDNVPDGNVPIQVLVGNAESPAGVTVAVQGDLTIKN
ncbi:MAG: hypothetical protein IT162_05305 [Bryobacterales bacterium]|nr:hypothetical protein [Bryobacterales bacterium]